MQFNALDLVQLKYPNVHVVYGMCTSISSILAPIRYTLQGWQSVASSSRVVVHTMAMRYSYEVLKQLERPTKLAQIHLCSTQLPLPPSSICLPAHSTVLALWFAILRHYSRSLVAVWHKFICSRRCRRKLPFYYCRRSWPSHHSYSRSHRLYHLLPHQLLLLLLLHLCLDLRLGLDLSLSHSVDSHHGDLIEFTLKLVMDICSSTNYSHPHTHSHTHKTTTEMAALGR